MKITFRLVFIIISACLFTGCKQKDQQTAVEDEIMHCMKHYGVPSVSVAVIHKGKIAWAKAYGMADEASQRMADTNTIYQVASMSKSVNAFCIMRLLQDGRLSLDADIRQQLHSWTFPDNALSKNIPITIRNLLSHTAGLSVHGFRGYLRSEMIPTINEILDSTPPSNSGKVQAILKPGTKVEYSGGGTLITKKILQDNIAANYDSLLTVMVLHPLEMNNSTFLQPLNAAWTNFATAYDEHRNEIPGKNFIYPEQAPDGLWTTATDYAQFIIAIQHSLAGEPSAVLNKQTVTTMLTPVLENSALGFFITSEGAQKYFGHGGSNNGFKSEFKASFSGGDGVVVLTNSDNGGKLCREIIEKVATVYQWKNH